MTLSPYVFPSIKDRRTSALAAAIELLAFYNGPVKKSALMQYFSNGTEA
jgi:hypothetical protein